MAKSSLVFLLFMVAQAAADYYCSWKPTYSDQTEYEWCDWGCCYTYIYPCCDTPYYADTPFIAGITCGGIALFVGLLILVVVRRRRVVTTVQYGQPGGQQVFSTSTAASNTNFVGQGYANPGFSQQYPATGYAQPPPPGVKTY